MSHRFAYHPGTGTYWHTADEWYIIEVPDSVIDGGEGELEDYLDYVGMFSPESNPEVTNWHECPGCHTTFALTSLFTK